MICPKCGEENKDGSLECFLCHEKFYHGSVKDCFGNDVVSNPMFTDIPKQASSLGKVFRFLVGVAIGGGAVGGGFYAYNASGEESNDIECIRVEKKFDGRCSWDFTEYADYDCKDGTKFRNVRCRWGLAFGCDWKPSKTYHSCETWEKKSNLPISRMK